MSTHDHGIGKRTLSYGASSGTNPRICPYAAVELRIDRATILLADVRDTHLPAVREAIERRHLDLASTAGVAMRRELREIEREARDARRLARALEDEASMERAAQLAADLEALVELAAPLMALAPPPAPLPEGPVLIAHVGGDAAAFQAERDERERAWVAQIERVAERHARTAAGVIDLAERRHRTKERT